MTLLRGGGNRGVTSSLALPRPDGSDRVWSCVCPRALAGGRETLTELITSKRRLVLRVLSRGKSLSRLIYVSSKKSVTLLDAEGGGGRRHAERVPRPARPHRCPLPVWTQRLVAFRRTQRPPPGEKAASTVAAAFRLGAKLPSETCFMWWEMAALSRRCSWGRRCFPGRAGPRCPTSVGPAHSSCGRGWGPGTLCTPADPGRPRLEASGTAASAWNLTWGSVHPDFSGVCCPLFSVRVQALTSVRPGSGMWRPSTPR